MTWLSCSQEELLRKIQVAEASMTPQQLAFWRRVRTTPEKWSLPPWGDVGGGFWVVALVDDEVIWYNDIEDGFNVSSIEDRGIIGQYWANQDELQWVIQRMANVV